MLFSSSTLALAATSSPRSSAAPTRADVADPRRRGGGVRVAMIGASRVAERWPPCSSGPRASPDRGSDVPARAGAATRGTSSLRRARRTRWENSAGSLRLVAWPSSPIRSHAGTGRRAMSAGRWRTSVSATISSGRASRSSAGSRRLRGRRCSSAMRATPTVPRAARCRESASHSVSKVEHVAGLSIRSSSIRPANGSQFRLRHGYFVECLSLTQ